MSLITFTKTGFWLKWNRPQWKCDEVHGNLPFKGYQISFPNGQLSASDEKNIKKVENLVGRKWFKKEWTLKNLTN